MSMNRLAIMAAIGTHNSMKNRTDDIRYNKHPRIEAHERPNGNSFNGDVNVLLGGAMFSVVVSLVCFLCYCCHRNLKRRDIIYRQRWVHVDPNMDVYSVEQYYDTAANEALDEDQYTQIMRNHGPPPAYEIAVTMKNPMVPEKCRLCQNKVRLSCACESCSVKQDKYDFEKTDHLMMRRESDQYLNVKNISQYQSSHFTSIDQRNIRETNDLEPNTETCQACDNELIGKNNNLCDEDVQNGNCQDDQLTSTCQSVRNCDACGKDIHASHQHDINDNVPSTSTDVHFCQNGDINSNYEESDDGETEFDSLNENGLIRVDMGKLLDQTGLPSYEAALKLESSGYV